MHLHIYFRTSSVSFFFIFYHRHVNVWLNSHSNGFVLWNLHLTNANFSWLRHIPKPDLISMRFRPAAVNIACSVYVGVGVHWKEGRRACWWPAQTRYHCWLSVQVFRSCCCLFGIPCIHQEIGGMILQNCYVVCSWLVFIILSTIIKRLVDTRYCSLVIVSRSC